MPQALFNINSFGDVYLPVTSRYKLRRLKSTKQKRNKPFKKLTNYDFGAITLKLNHFADLIFISEVSRKNVTN